MRGGAWRSRTISIGSPYWNDSERVGAYLEEALGRAAHPTPATAPAAFLAIDELSRLHALFWTEPEAGQPAGELVATVYVSEHVVDPGVEAVVGQVVRRRLVALRPSRRSAGRGLKLPSLTGT